MIDMLVKMTFGSRLYGTATPDSDHDYKGVFMPTAHEVLVGRIPKSHNHSTGDNTSKNTSQDVDTEFYSLHYFVKLAVGGETAAFDMLHAPLDGLLVSTPIWRDLVANRTRFYSRSMRAFIGYARRQASKYGVKGSRLAEAKQVLEIMRAQDPNARLRDIWELLIEGEHTRKLPSSDPRHPHLLYEVCGRKLTDTGRIGHQIETVERFVENYGERARMAERNEGVDWGAVSHALRAGYQMRRILTEGTFSYPLPEAPFLVRVKLGELQYRDVARQLDDLIDECEELSARSELPERCDQKWWDGWLADTVWAKHFSHGRSPRRSGESDG